ncbi:MAG: AMP-binding protein, partial [candidate division Zixibacteria bacterium]|nr:AMP-binding protein [candidate division Zixibacteria bacterium]
LIKLLHTPTALRAHPRRGTYNSQGGKEDKYLLMVDMHHIISDGMSTELLVQDFMALYSDEALPVMRYRYKDYGEWQHRRKESKKYQEQARFWQEEFKAEIPVLDLPTDYIRSAVQRFEGSSLGFEIDKPHTGALNVLALGEGATLYMMLLAIYTIFLSRISNQEDIVIGAPVAGRRHVDLEKIIGMFVNTLALRNYPSGETEFTEFLAEVKEKTLEAFENQEYQYEELVEQVAVNRDVSRNPLFDTMFVLQNTGPGEIEVPGLRVIPYEYENKTSKFDLTLIGVEAEDKLLFTFEYSTKLFKPETIERFITYFKNIVTGVLEDKHRKISGVEIIIKEEKNRLLVEFNDTETDYPQEKTIHELFTEQAEKTPDYIAVVYSSNQVTYRELNERSNHLAAYLCGKGVEDEEPVGIMTEHCVEMVTGILAVLKAGGVYLPVNPDYPDERKEYLSRDGNVKILLTDCKNTGCYGPEAIQLHDTDTDTGIYNFKSVEDLNSKNSKKYAGNLSYIIYTSGSTG